VLAGQVPSTEQVEMELERMGVQVREALEREVGVPLLLGG
jgi:hypothetical protein